MMPVNESGILGRKFRQLGVRAHSASDSQKVDVYQAVLQEMSEVLLNSDARRFTRDFLDVLLSDLTEIIKHLSSMRYESGSTRIQSLDAVVSYLRDSRTELYVASDMDERKKNQSFFRCINKAGDQIEKALLLF